MTLIGKILVFVIFVMSIIFMTFTMLVYSTHRNWSEVAKALDTKVKNAEQLIQEKTNEREQLETRLAHERASRAEALAVLESTKRALQEELQQSKQKYEELFAANQQAVNIFEENRKEMSRLKDEVEKIREEIRVTRLDRDTQLAKARDLTEKLNQGEGELRRLKERSDELVSQLSRAQLVLDRNDLSIDAPIDGMPPKVDGVVTAVRDENQIEVSIGADEGLRRGHTLEVYRQDGGYLGRVIVIETNPDRAVTRVIPEFRQGVIRKGDRVATRLL
jgi:hypothetical protein